MKSEPAFVALATEEGFVKLMDRIASLNQQ
jgi:hypothetical protein